MSGGGWREGGYEWGRQFQSADNVGCGSQEKNIRIPSPGFTLGFVQVDRLLTKFTVDLADLNG